MSAPSLPSKIKVHRPLVEEIISALLLIFGENKSPDRTIESVLKSQRKWGSRDRRFFAENIYECVRWWRRLWFSLGEEHPKIDRQNLWRLWGAYHLTQGGELPRWPELEGINLVSHFSPGSRAIQESVPDWVDQLGQKELGARWESILHSLNEKSTVDLRVNSLKARRAQVQEALRVEGIETIPIPGTEEGLQLLERKNFFSSAAYIKGWFEVQDRASQKVAGLLAPQPGEFVIDACAGAGGKTLHLAALMKNQGQILSMDLRAHKLKVLEQRALRNGVRIVKTRISDSSENIKDLPELADRLLLDVPCSGLGVWRRKPGDKWQLTPSEIAKLTNLQRKILQAGSGSLKIGGHLVYATCSFLPSENENQISWFLKETPSYSLLRQIRIDPDMDQGDGFFAALLVKRY